MKKHDVIKALGNYYELEKFSLDKLDGVYQSNKEKYPLLNLDHVFKILKETPERLSPASLERNLRIKFSIIYSNLQEQKSQFESQGKSCPRYILRFMKMIENLSGHSLLDELSTVGSTRTLTL